MFIIIFAATTTLVFSDQAGKKENNYFSVAPGFGIAIPVGEYAAAFGIGYTPTGGYSIRSSTIGQCTRLRQRDSR